MRKLLFIAICTGSLFGQDIYFKSLEKDSAYLKLSPSGQGEEIPLKEPGLELDFKWNNNGRFVNIIYDNNYLRCIAASEPIESFKTFSVACANATGGIWTEKFILSSEEKFKAEEKIILSNKKKK